MDSDDNNNDVMVMVDNDDDEVESHNNDDDDDKEDTVASSNTILGQEQRYNICRSEGGTKVRCIFEIIYYILDISGSGRR